MTDGENSILVLLGENVDRQVIAYLRAEGHEGEQVVDALDASVAATTTSLCTPANTTTSSSPRIPISWR